MKRLIFVALLIAATGVAGGGAISHATPDVLDCGSDTRGEWIDMQADFEYPAPPPEETHPTLQAAGCPATGEPHYAKPFSPDADSGDQPGHVESYDGSTHAAPESSSSEPREQRSKPRKRCSKKQRASKAKKRCCSTKENRGTAKRKWSCRRG
jgi:hypothetical protein